MTDTEKLVEYVLNHGPISATTVSEKSGVKLSYAKTQERLRHYADNHGRIVYDPVRKLWSKAPAQEMTRRIPKFRELRGYDLYQNAMRPGCRDHEKLPSRYA
jgi:hypothetical protein